MGRTLRSLGGNAVRPTRSTEPLLRSATTMWSHLRSALVLACFAGTTFAAQAGTPGVKDNADFFKDSAAVGKADAQARELKRLYHKDILVETFAEVPAGERERVAKLTGSARDSFFEGWTDSRMQAA